MGNGTKDQNITFENNKFERKELIDKFVKSIFLFIAILCASFVIFIVIFICVKGLQPFVSNYATNPGEVVKQDIGLFFTNERWLYDGTGGMLYLLLTTLYTTLLSLIISVPTSVFTALFIVRMVPKRLKSTIKTCVELLSSIPSVIYGIFGMGVICTLVRDLPIQTAGGSSILSAVIVLALMSIPTMTMVSTNAIEAVDPKLVSASVALGASNAQTNIKIVLSCAKSGIFAGIILGVGRALGEATAVQMVIGNNALGTGFYNPFNSGMTLTSAMLSGIGEATGIRYDVRFSLAIVLILVILAVTSILNYVKLKMDTLKTKNSNSVLKKLGNTLGNEFELLRAYINEKFRKDNK